jgi:hypothetical protein
VTAARRRIQQRRQGPLSFNDEHFCRGGTPEDFFRPRGFELTFSLGEGFVWADLSSKTSGLAAPKYGRGDDERSAASSAVAHWRAEQGD